MRTAYGHWLPVNINAIVILFAFTCTRPNTRRGWPKVLSELAATQPSALNGNGTNREL